MIRIDGRQGKSVIVEGTTVKILKKGSILAAERNKTIPIRNITSVEVKKPGAMFVGFIQFSIAGGKARDSSFTLSGGAYDAVQDENSIVFSDQEAYQKALEIKEYVENFSEPRDQGNATSNSVADEILKLKSLLDQGILTQSEFDEKKKQLLGI